MAFTEPLRDRRDVDLLLRHFDDCGEWRNLALASLCVYTALRVGDVLGLVWGDVYDFEVGRFRREIALVEAKTGKRKGFALHKDLVVALGKHFAALGIVGRDCAIIANGRTKCPLSRVQAYRILRGAGETLRLSCRVTCHGLRKTFGYHAWKGGASPAVVMAIFNHSSFEVTKRYLGVARDDMDAVYLGMRFRD